MDCDELLALFPEAIWSSTGRRQVATDDAAEAMDAEEVLALLPHVPKKRKTSIKLIKHFRNLNYRFNLMFYLTTTYRGHRNRFS